MNGATKELYLAHFGIKGQKWGVRRYQNEDGSLTGEGRSHYGVGENKDWKRLKKDASDDAKRWAAAKAYYGKGAGNRRKKVKNSISERMKDPDYKAEFEKQLASQNMEKHQRNANLERHTRDTAETTARIIKTAASVAITGLTIAYVANPNLRYKVSQVVNKFGSAAFQKASEFGNKVKTAFKGRRTFDDFMKTARVAR